MAKLIAAVALHAQDIQKPATPTQAARPQQHVQASAPRRWVIVRLPRPIALRALLEQIGIDVRKDVRAAHRAIERAGDGQDQIADDLSLEALARIALMLQPRSMNSTASQSSTNSVTAVLPPEQIAHALVCALSVLDLERIHRQFDSPFHTTN